MPSANASQALASFQCRAHHVVEVGPGHVLSRMVKRISEQLTAVSLDDARAPLACLFWLSTLPFQELKIDLSIAPEWTTQARSEGVLRSLIELVHKLELSVIATDVADDAQADKLKELGCDFMQADFRGPPVDAQEFVTRYAG